MLIWVLPSHQNDTEKSNKRQEDKAEAAQAHVLIEVIHHKLECVQRQYNQKQQHKVTMHGDKVMKVCTWQHCHNCAHHRGESREVNCDVFVCVSCTSCHHSTAQFAIRRGDSE